jgi:hypothetical protein
MKRLICASILCLFLASAITAQDRCNIDLSIAPDIRGIRLGLKIEEVKAMFPDSLAFKLAPQPDEANVIDSADLTLLDWYQKREKFTGVESISLIFVDGRIVKIGALYDKTADWPNVDSFSAQLSKSLALPGWAWRVPKNADPKIARVMDCDGFRVIAVAQPGSRAVLGLVDTAAEKMIEKRRADIAEKKRQSFKP